MGDLKKNISRIYRYSELIREHIDKIELAFSESNYPLIGYYKVETRNFVKEAEKIIDGLNKHQNVLDAIDEFQKEKNNLEKIIEKYEKYC